MTTSVVNKEIVIDFTQLALKHSKRLRIAYVDKKGGTEVRVIEPFVLAESIMSAYCLLRKGPRHFSLDRVARIMVLDEDITQENPFVKSKEEQENAK